MTRQVGETSMGTIESHRQAWQRYREAREALFEHLCAPFSNREPMAEFAEVLVADLLDGRLADSRTQKGWDVELAGGRRVQVRHLANRSGRWNNWHHVVTSSRHDMYALVVFVDLTPVAVHIFPSDNLGAICDALGKRHANQRNVLRYTWGNYRDIRDDPERFRALGMHVLDLR